MTEIVYFSVGFKMTPCCQPTHKAECEGQTLTFVNHLAYRTGLIRELKKKEKKLSSLKYMAEL